MKTIGNTLMVDLVKIMTVKGAFNKTVPTVDGKEALTFFHKAKTLHSQMLSRYTLLVKKQSVYVCVCVCVPFFCCVVVSKV